MRQARRSSRLSGASVNHHGSPPLKTIQVKMEDKKPPAESTTGTTGKTDSTKRNRIENIRWLMSNSETVTKEDVKEVLSAKPRAARFCQKLVDRLETSEAAGSSIRTLDVLHKLWSVIYTRHQYRAIFVDALCQADVLKQLFKCMDAHERVVALQVTAIKFLRAIVKYSNYLLEHPQCIPQIIKAMRAHPSDVDVQLVACKAVAQYTASKRQDRIRRMIQETPLCLETLAAAADNFSGPSYFAVAATTRKIFRNMAAGMFQSGKKVFPDWEPVLELRAPKNARPRLECIDEYQTVETLQMKVNFPPYYFEDISFEEDDDDENNWFDGDDEKNWF